MFRRFLVSVSLCIAALYAARPAGAQDTSALINEALDRSVELDLNDVLPAAMRVIESKTSVPIRAEPIVWDLLPWGEQTNITARIHNQSLRQALTAIAQKLGLTFAIADETVLLQPVPGLRRLGRRSTVQELTSLSKLAGEPMPAVPGAGNVRAILTAIDLRLEAMKLPLAIEDRLDAETRGKIVILPRNATMMDGLEQITKQTRGTWYPWAKTIVVVPKETQVRDQLSKTLTTRYRDADVNQVLEDLRKRAGVPFEIEPGALQRLPADARTVRVFWDNVSVQQALESLKGVTGLDYQVTEAGVKITNPTPPGAVTLSDPVVAMVQLENGMSVLVRESQIPADLRAYLQRRLDKSVDSLRKLAEEEKSAARAPTTKPLQ